MMFCHGKPSLHNKSKHVYHTLHEEGSTISGVVWICHSTAVARFIWNSLIPTNCWRASQGIRPDSLNCTHRLLGGAPGIHISAVHDTTCLFRPPCEQLCSHALAVPLRIESGTPLTMISLASQRAELPTYHCNVNGKTQLSGNTR